MNSPHRLHGTRLRRHSHAGGFTLAEMLTSMSIFALIFGMLVQFNYQTMSTMVTTELKADINRDLRVVTEQLSNDAREADFFVLYANYTVAARTTPSQELPEANSGDFAVFVTYGTAPNAAKFNIRPIAEIIGYYRAPYQTNQVDPITNSIVTLMPVHRFDLTVANGGLPANQYLLVTGSSDLPSGGTATTLEALLPNASQTTIDSHQIVIELAQGLSDGCLFHNFWGKSLMLNGKIVQGNNYQSAHDTYNFTISPRG